MVGCYGRVRVAYERFGVSCLCLCACLYGRVGGCVDMVVGGCVRGCGLVIIWVGMRVRVYVQV